MLLQVITEKEGVPTSTQDAIAALDRAMDKVLALTKVAPSSDEFQINLLVCEVAQR